MSDIATSLPQLLTEPEAASYLGIEVWALAKLRRAKQIEHLLVTQRNVRYTSDILAAYLRKCTVQAKDTSAAEAFIDTDLARPLRRSRADFPQPRVIKPRIF